jgi:hypothetical protein
MPQGSRSESLYAAIEERVDGAALTQLLVHARRSLSNHSSLTMEYPAGEMVDAIQAAGLKVRRTLLWMRV